MPKKKIGCLSQIVRGANILLISLTGISFAAAYFPPSSFFGFTFLGMAFPILFILNLLFVIFWIFRQKWYFLLSLFTIIMTWSACSKFIGNPFQSPKQIDGQLIKVMTFNAGGGLLYKPKNRNELFSLLKRVKPDVICFQELIIKGKKVASIDAMYPYHKRIGFRVIYSKYPIGKQATLNLASKSSYNGGDWTDIKVSSNQTVRVYNLHLQSNKITGKVARLSKETELKEINDKKTLRQTKNILELVQQSAKIREQQAEKVHTSIQHSPHPVIVCGDFNDPPQSYTYETISEGLKDAFVRAGHGLGFSYKGNLPFLKIDYTFVSPEIEVISSKVLSSSASDHEPVVSKLIIPK